MNSEYQSINDPNIQRRVVRSRIMGLALLLACLLVTLLLRYYDLQIKDHQRYATLSDENRVHVRAVPPTRGLIFDRNGVILAENRPSYTLSVVAERTEDLDQTLAELKQLLGLTNTELQRFEEQKDQCRRPYGGIPLRFQLTEEDVALLAVNEFRLPGIEVEVELVRHYPFGKAFAHSVGYVGRINDREQALINKDRYQGTHVIGKIGIEKQYEDLLHGSVGYEYVETDARGNVLRVLEREDATPGEDLYLSIDSRLQTRAEELLSGRRASVVALDIETGEVLALLSAPSYDANLFVTGISYSEYDRLLHDINRPLYDRALLGQYPPGSTVKPLYALAGLTTGVVTEDWSIQDYGRFQLPNQERVYRDWKREGHGKVDLRIAIEQSCDVYFYELGNMVGIDVLSEFGHLFGLGQKTGIDMPSEMSGIMPSREWKRAARGLAWYPGDTINASIGQGFSLTTPLQLAQMTANIARRGVSLRPHMVHAVNEVEVEVPGEPLVDINSEHWNIVHSAMEAVVHSIRGTASAQGRGLTFRMAGKTGTAQVVGIPQDAEYDRELLEEFKLDHALFVSFAPVEDPKIAIAVVIENGEHGSSVAAPVARELTVQWLSENPWVVSQTESSNGDRAEEKLDAI